MNEKRSLSLTDTVSIKITQRPPCLMPYLVKLSFDIQPERRPWTERALLQAPAEENGPCTEPCRSSAEEGSVLELQPVQRHIPLGSSVIKSLWPTGTVPHCYNKTMLSVAATGLLPRAGRAGGRWGLLSPAESPIKSTPPGRKIFQSRKHSPGKSPDSLCLSSQQPQ